MTEREALKLALEFITASNQRSEFWLVPSSNLNKTVTAIREVLGQPEQEPVAWLHTKIEGVAVPHRPADLDKHPDRWEALYKTPPPCQTCEALARTVMLDQTSHDTAPPQRKPLEGVIDVRPIGYHSLQLIFRSQTDIAEFKTAHGVKE